MRLAPLSHFIFSLLVLGSLLSLPSFAQTDPRPLLPTDLAGLRYTNDFFPGTTYRASVPKLDSLLGFPAAERAATASEIEKCLKAWAVAVPERVKLVEYAHTHENRPLHYMIVTSPGNLGRIDEIQAGLAKLGDPRQLSKDDASRLINGLPAVAWLAYTIHGDETEGSDAALVLLYHLIAAADPEVEALLEKVVVIVDPLMNPDGRDRFLKMVAEHRGTMPNVDDQSLLHTGHLPWGRGNHYYFDLNRDWIYGVHPETRGRIRELSKWNPVLFVDAHGMGAQDTHLFSPPREPINPNVPSSRERWAKVFARDQARDFDQHGLLYYHGEWNEDWYPGYSDSWPAYRGGIGILYEQARIAEDGVRRPEGRILSYRESVLHHVLGSMANLTTLQAHAKELLENFYNVRNAALDPKGKYANRTFAVLPTHNQSRLRNFLSLALLQGFEVYQASNEFAVSVAKDQLGREVRNRTLPAGTILIPNRQPLGHLVAASLEFDPRIPAKSLSDERQELLRKGRSRIYDVTAWNLTMMFGLEALTLESELPAVARAYQLAPAANQAGMSDLKAPAAYIIDGADDLSLTAAARLMERGVQVRLAVKSFRFDDRAFSRGSVVLARLDNRALSGDLTRIIGETARELGLQAQPVNTGYAEGDLPNLGSEHFKRLEPPRIALLTRGGSSPQEFGEIWFMLDHQVAVRHSHLDIERDSDLSRYNVVIVPDRFGGPLPGVWTSQLREWVKAGGTLIALGNSAAQLAQEKAEFSKARLLPDVLGKLSEYELAIFREWFGREGGLPSLDAIWSHTAAPSLQYPWQAIDGGHADEKELKKRDAWQRLFMPIGAILAGRTDTNHWLTVGCGEMLPLLALPQPVLMAAEGVEAPIRFGYFTELAKRGGDVKTSAAAEHDKPKDDSSADKSDSDKKDKKEPPRIGWAALPPGTEMHLRMSGLLWPEAAHRLANSAYCTRESYGRGQIILFASGPAFRAATVGSARILLNAIIYGPGCGASQPVRP